MAQRMGRGGSAGRGEGPSGGHSGVADSLQWKPVAGSVRGDWIRRNGWLHNSVPGLRTLWWRRFWAQSGVKMSSRDLP